MDKTSKIFSILRIAFWVGIVILLILKFLLTSNLHGNFEFLRTHKFMTSDSYDWIANGVDLFKSPEITFRNPGLAIIIKILFMLNKLSFLPLLNQVVFGGIMFVIFKILSKLVKHEVTPYIAVSLIFANYSLQNFSYYLLADYYAIFLILVSVLFLFKDKINLSLLFLGFSLIFQNFAYFLIPVWFGFIYIKEQKVSELKDLFNIYRIFVYMKSNFLKLTTRLLILLNFNLFWFAYKYYKFGDPLYTKILQIGFLSPNFNSILFYFVNLYTLYGILFFILIWFLIIKFKDYKRNIKMLFLSVCFLITLIFWVIFYNWNDRRFLLYLLTFFYPIIGYIFDRYFVKLNLKWLITVSIIIVYSTTISLGCFFNSSVIPLTNWDRIIFQGYIIEEDYDQYFIKFPIHLDHDRYSIKSVVAAVNPTFAQLVYNSKSNKFNKDTNFSKYERIIFNRSSRKEEELCGRSNAIFFYELSSISRIFNKELLDNESLKYQCDY